MISLGLIFLAITIVGIFGNVLVILVIGVNRQLHDSTNILICNLAVADLLFLTFCVPITAYSYIYMWNFSESICYVTVTLQYVTCYVSVWTLVLLSYDRYVSITSPSCSINMRRGHTVFYVCLTLWLVIFGLNFSQMQGVGVLSFHFNGSVGMACVDSLSIATETSTPLNARLFYWGFNFCAYVLPLTLSSLFYFLLVRSIWKQKMVQSKSSEKMKKHATKMVFIVIITFGVCWFPQNLRFFLRGLSYPDMTFWEESAPELLLYVQSTIQVLAYANSCVNPILYGVLSERFRVGVNVAWHRFVCCDPNADRHYWKKRSTLVRTTRGTSTNQTRALQLSEPNYPEFSSKSNKLGCDSNSKNTTARGGKRKRLGGGGRPVLHPDLDVELAEWIKEVRENKRIVSRNIIRNKANELFHGTDIKISNGWLEKFLLRHNFSLRCVGSAAQKPPEKYAEVVARFIVYVEQRRKEVQFTQIIAMDETAVWFDCPDNRTIETKGAKSVTVVTTGHEKMRVTVCLSARSDGRKLPPYVLINRKRFVPAIVNQFKGKLVISWSGTVWMNDSITEDYLRKIIGGKLFSGKRLLVSDAFASHKSEKTAAVMKELDIEAAYIPGGCTKFIQAPDVSWNGPFKAKIRHYYNLWMTNEDRREWTAAGNPKAPGVDVVLDWVDRAWQDLSKETIINSFKACALTTPTDGSGDDQITCFKRTGPIGAKGLDILREIRTQEGMRDGRDDYEEAGLPEDEEEMELEGVNEHDRLLFT